ncbi:LLM class flavin-dependent oxidoreductase [Dactylosporangium sp. CA-233914]|uniref:LLM class flavin-dependent oxidoreductase n=1 Tax=Dactylosporangium sp. CA-233914 TaxID=3239934 RepID=UPI003D8F204A
MTAGAFEFSCTTIPSRQPAELRDLALAATRLGYDRFWVPDQELYADPFLLLNDIAAATPIHLGLALTNPFSRHPVQIARAMASLVHLDRRNPAQRSWVLGLGMGNVNLVLNPLGLGAGATTSRLVASISLVRALLAGETVQPAPDAFVHTALSLDIEPADCRIYLGTRGPKTLAAGGRVADGILAEALFRPELVRWTRQQAGLLPGDRHVSWQTVVILRPGEAIPEAVRHFAAMLIRTTAPAVLELMGVSDRARTRARERRLTPQDVTDDDVRRFVACGSTEEIAAMVMAAQDAGVTGWTAIFLGGAARIADAMHEFAEGVIAPVRARSTG